jgi:antibiotic biosynthesis monooxygenase (ABM) superfamily enzyme
MSVPPIADESATVVITHRIRNGCGEAYEKWLGEIGPICKRYPGHMHSTIIRPVAGASETYTIVIRFDNRERLLAWMQSEDRKSLLERVRPILDDDDKFTVESGMDFWFTPEEAHARLPKRWKQAFITWTAIFPLVYLVGHAMNQVAAHARFIANAPARLLIDTAIVCLLMAYVVMPKYTRLMQRWLFR